MFDKIKEKLFRFIPEEKREISAFSLLSLILTVEIIFLLSKNISISRIKKEIEIHEKQYEEMLSLHDEVLEKKITGLKYIPRDRSLTGLITLLAQKHGMEFEAIKPGAPADKGTYIINSVSLKFTSLSFKSFSEFIEEIENEYGSSLAVKRIKIEKSMKGEGIDGEVEIEGYQEK